MATLQIPVKLKTATASGQVPTSLGTGELGFDPWLGKLWWADNTGVKQSVALPGLVSTAALTAALGTVAQVDDLRQVMIAVAKLTGSVLGLVAGVADDFRDQTGVDAANSANASYDSTNRLFTNTTVDAYTQALLHFDGTNGSNTVTDASAKAHSFAASGNALISTAQSKFGGSSVSFSTAKTDVLTAAASADFSVGSGDFTVEGWVYLNAYPGSSYLFDTRSAAGNGFSIYIDGQGFINYNSPNSFASAGTIALGGWHHIAVSRASGTVRLFIDGVLDTNTATDTTAYPATMPLRLGSSFTVAQAFNGYIDEFRYTVGLARYTATFTPQASAFGISGSTTAAGPLDLRSVAYPASAVPSKGSIYLLAKPLGSGTITPNTNLTASLSRNGGTTYTPVTLVAAGTLSSGFSGYEANGVDLTAQSSAQNMKWRIQTTGTLAVQVQAVVEQWG